MIYEHQMAKHRVFIEWSRSAHWGDNDETKWIATCHGSTLASGPTPEAVLGVLIEGRGQKTLDGLCPSAIGLPPTLGGWTNSRA